MRKIENLRDIFFAESYKFFRFVKAKDTKMCVDVPINKAFGMLENFFHYLKDPNRQPGDYVRTCYETVANLIEKSNAMNRSGFVMQVKLFTVVNEPDGKQKCTTLHGVQYQVLKFQRSRVPGSSKETFTLYFSGATGENTAKVTPDKLAHDKRGGVYNAVTKNLQGRFDKKTMAYYVTFFTVRNDVEESKLDGDKKIRRQAALQLYRSYSARSDEYDHHYFKGRPPVGDAYN